MSKFEPGDIIYDAVSVRRTYGVVKDIAGEHIRYYPGNTVDEARNCAKNNRTTIISHSSFLGLWCKKGILTSSDNPLVIDWGDIKEPVKKKCSCEIVLLMREGCKCGGI